MRQTHTFAVLKVSPAAYQEIAGKLREAGYDHAFVGEGGATIDMHGIGLEQDPGGVAAKPQIEVQLEKLSLSADDVLVVRGDFGGEPIVPRGLAAELTRRGIWPLVVLLNDAGATLESLDEAAMARHGWVRAPKSFGGVPCPACGGAGAVSQAPEDSFHRHCRTCHGTGKVPVVR